MTKRGNVKRNTNRFLTCVALVSSASVSAFQTPGFGAGEKMLRPSTFRAFSREYHHFQSAISHQTRRSNGWNRFLQMSTTSDSQVVQELKEKISAKGNEIRQGKSNGLDKDSLKPLIDELVQLKSDFEAATGTPYDKPKESKKKKKAPAPKKKQATEQKSDYITPREEDYSQWYLDIVAAADLVDQSPVRGCMVIKPWGMAIWDALKDDLDKKIKEKDVQNAYFPLFIPRSFLSKEAEHVEGFAKECAVVTHHRLCADPEGKGLIPDPDAKLEEPLIVRPTSETIIWNMFGKWIDSYRDLPLKINQWANVVRWELRTRPFLRSAEFLWQEGHTAHSSSEEALGCAEEMLDVYEKVCNDLLGVHVIKGVKSPSERFAGAEETFTIEALMQNGWALQSGTSHFLGQNFARAFDVFFQTADGGRELVWATSWGVSTRLLGALVMTHSDDAGLVLPPPIAPVQVVIVPIIKGEGEDTKLVNSKVDEMVASLKSAGIRVKVDDRPNMRPGAKYFEWERKGVPMRIEIGPRDAKSEQCVLALRTGGDKTSLELPNKDGKDFSDKVSKILSDMHSDLLNKAKERTEAHTFKVDSYEEMKSILEMEDRSKLGFFLVPWHCDADNEEAIKQDCKATIRCYPLDLNHEGAVEGKTCFYSGKPATHMALFARAF